MSETTTPATVDLVALANEIATHLEVGQQFGRKCLEAYRMAGEKLLAAQKAVWERNGGRKGWGRWLRSQPSLPTQPQCDKYMKLAEHWNTIQTGGPDCTTLSGALARIDAALGKPTNGKGEDHLANDELAAQDNGEQTGRENGDQTDDPAVQVGVHHRTSVRFGNGHFLPRLDGDTWGVQAEANADAVNLLLPLRAEKKDVSARLTMTKAEARHLVQLLSDLL